MSRALYRLADMSYRHRRLVLVGWLAVILAVVSVGLLSRGTTVDNFSVPGTQSQQALTQLEQALPTLAAPSTQVVFASTGTATVTGPAGRAAMETSITRLRSGPPVASDPDIDGARLPAITAPPGGPGTTPGDDAEAEQQLKPGADNRRPGHGPVLSRP